MLKLKRIDESIESRARHASHYIQKLSGIPELRFPSIRKGVEEVYYVFNILAKNRNGLQNSLKDAGIGTSVYYPKPLHLQKCFEHLGYKEGDFPVSERISKQILALPMHPDFTDDEVDYVCSVIRDFYG